jgi:hypothetical protein
MTLYWIYDLPPWLFGIVCIGAFIAFGLLGTQFTRAFVRRVHQEDHSHNDIVGYYLSAVTVFYGITLGLVAIGTWNNYAAIQDKVDREAQVVASLYRDVNVYPEPGRTLLTGDLRRYTREVIDHSWPQMRHGVIPTGSAPMLDDFQGHLLQFHPADMGQQVLYSEAYRQFNNLVEVRRSRLDSVHTSLPRSLWWMVLLGALTCIAATWFFHMRSDSMHRWMTVLMAGLLGLMIFLVATLDNPFRGKVSVGPDSLERVYEQLVLLSKKPSPVVAMPAAPGR